MSKEVDNVQKASINRKLLSVQITDCIVLFIMVGIIFYLVNFLSFTSYELGIVLCILFLVVSLFSEYNKNVIKKYLEDLITASVDSTMAEVNTIQARNNSQKEHNVISSSKIKSMQGLVDNLQKYSNEMSTVTALTREKTDQSLNFTNNEYSAVKTNIEKMFSIRHKIQTIAELILELSDFVQSISSTIGLVEDIAEQTNLLALNAAVEAARAGEHGKGFAVVASEIRKLADESKQATTKIISLINDIQQTANSTVLATEEGTKEIESGLELAHVISENIEQLINVMNEISSNVQKIIVSSKLINNDSKSTDNYIKEVSKIVEENQKLAKETEQVFIRIESTSNELKQTTI